MPKRQQTQGDFGQRPTKVTQGITDTYAAPSIPAPDLSALQALSTLSKTAHGLLQDRRDTAIRQQKAGEEFGEENPDAVLDLRGTTEAAMIGFQRGRGAALQNTYRTGVMGEWATLQEQNEDLKLQPEAFGAFIQKRETEFIMDHGIEGLALQAFGSGRDDWMLEQTHTNNLASVKFQKDVFKTDMREVTAASVGQLEPISILTEQLSGTDILDHLDANITLDAPATLLELPNGNLVPHTSLSSEDMRDPAIRIAAENHLKRQAIRNNTLPPIQEVLQKGYEVGGSTEQEVRSAVVSDLVASLAEGNNPEETWMLLEELKSGTGLLVDTDQFQAAVEARRGDIEANEIKQRQSYAQRIDFFMLERNVDGNTTWEQLNSGLLSIEVARQNKTLTEDQAFKHTTKLIDNWDSAEPARAAKQKTTIFKSIAFGVVDGDYNQLGATELIAAIEAEQGVKLTEKELRFGVSQEIFADAAREPDPVKRAQRIVESLQHNGLFATKVPIQLTDTLNAAANRATTDSGPKNTAGIEGALHLYTASKGLLSGIGVNVATENYFSFLEAQVKKGETIDTAIQVASEVATDWGAEIPDAVTRSDVKNAMPDDTAPAVIQQVMMFANNELRATNGNPVDAIEMAQEVMKDLNYGTIGGGDAEHPFRFTRGETQEERTFNAKANHYSDLIVRDLQAQWKSDEKSIEAIEDKLKKTYQWGAIGEEFAIHKLHTESGKKLLSGPMVRILGREFRGTRLEAAYEIFEAENGRPAMQAQRVFEDANMDGDTPNNTRIGLTSTMDDKTPVYTMRNLDTRAPITLYEGKEMPTKMSAAQMVELFDPDANEMLNDLAELKEHGGDSRGQPRQR